MTSILTNTAASAAIKTLRSIDLRLGKTQDQISTGMRINTAAENSAYWSVSMTMRSDSMAISTVADALGFGAAMTDIAYLGMNAVVDILSEFRSRLVAAKEPGVDKNKIQKELDQLKSQVISVATSSSFNGINWLSTNISDINDSAINKASLVCSFRRDANNGVSVITTDFHLSETALFNDNGGGILQVDTRKMKTLGGIRTHDTYMDTNGIVHAFPVNSRTGVQANFKFNFTGPVFFDATSTISFDVTVDADNPADLDGPYELGKTTHVVIDRASVDAWLPGQNGLVSTYQQFTSLLYRALSASGSDAAAANLSDGHGGTVPDVIVVSTRESSGLDGSSIQITNLVENNINPSGLANTAIKYASRQSHIELTFAPFEVYHDGDNFDGVQVDFDFGVNGSPRSHYSFDRTYVNTLLGKETGKIETADEMVTLLTSLIGSDWPDVIIDIDPAGKISLRSDKDVDRLSGAKTYIGFTNISVSIEPLGEQNFIDIDIASNPNKLDYYLGYLEVVSADVINAAAKLGAISGRIAMQAEFANTLKATLDRGIGRLVDADMDESSTRLKALQTQQQLAIQALQIANGNAEHVMQLFRQ